MAIDIELNQSSLDLLSLGKSSYTPKEVSIALADELTIGVDAAYQRLMRWIRSGRIPAIKRYIHEYRINRETVERILKGEHF